MSQNKMANTALLGYKNDIANKGLQNIYSYIYKNKNALNSEMLKRVNDALNVTKQVYNDFNPNLAKTNKKIKTILSTKPYTNKFLKYAKPLSKTKGSVARAGGNVSKEFTTKVLKPPSISRPNATKNNCN